MFSNKIEQVSGLIIINPMSLMDYAIALTCQLTKRGVPLGVILEITWRMGVKKTITDEFVDNLQNISDGVRAERCKTCDKYLISPADDWPGDEGFYCNECDSVWCYQCTHPPTLECYNCKEWRCCYKECAKCKKTICKYCMDGHVCISRKPRPGKKVARNVMA